MNASSDAFIALAILSAGCNFNDASSAAGAQNDIATTATYRWCRGAEG